MSKVLKEAVEYAVHELIAMRGTDYPEGNFDCLVCDATDKDKHREGCPAKVLQKALEETNQEEDESEKLLWVFYKIAMLAMRELGHRQAWQLLDEDERTRELYDEWCDASEDRSRAYQNFIEFMDENKDAKKIVRDLEKKFKKLISENKKLHKVRMEREKKLRKEMKI